MKVEKNYQDIYDINKKKLDPAHLEMYSKQNIKIKKNMLQ